MKAQRRNRTCASQHVISIINVEIIDSTTRTSLIILKVIKDLCFAHTYGCEHYIWVKIKTFLYPGLHALKMIAKFLKVIRN